MKSKHIFRLPVRYAPPRIISLAGDSDWFKYAIRRGATPTSQIEVTEIHAMRAKGKRTPDIRVHHNSIWEVFGDSGFLTEVGKMVGYSVTFAPQEKQRDNIACLRKNSLL